MVQRKINLPIFLIPIIIILMVSTACSGAQAITPTEEVAAVETRVITSESESLDADASEDADPPLEETINQAVMEAQIEPASEPVILSDTYNVQMPVLNEEIYSSTEMFPGTLYSKIGTYSCRGYTILVLKLNPVQYIPARGELFYYPDLTVNVETIAEMKDNSLFRGLRGDNNDIGKKVDNPSMGGIYMQTLESAPVYLNYDLLIITSEALKSGFSH